MKSCTVCGSEKIAARGWCSKHYERWKRTGDPEKTIQFSNKDENGNPVICYVDGCDAPTRSRGLCHVHYTRLRSQGTTNYVGKLNEGASRHPLYITWKNARRKGCIAEWNLFATFVADVGERPHFMAHFLRPDPDRPLGPDNWAWSRKRPKRNGRWPKASNKLWHARNARKRHGAMLKMRFGITVEAYDELHSKQGGVCRICGKTKRKRLAVDHCHTTGVIRGLLCSSCNAGLGLFQDDPTLLELAIVYLRDAKGGGNEQVSGSVGRVPKVRVSA